MRFTRRELLASSSALLVRGQGTAPVRELVNAFEFEAAAQRKLGAEAYQMIAGGDRAPFERMTFRPRLMVNTTRLDLTLDLFGESLFAPILVGPVADQKRFHAEGELAMMRGAAAAKAVVVISSRASYPIEEIVGQTKASTWYQVDAGPEMIARAQSAVKCGCKAVMLTLDGADWQAVDRLRDAVTVPLLLKGIMNPEEAKTALDHGVKGMVVSNYNGRSYNAAAPAITVLPEIVEALGGEAPILIDGSFRRGSDILKALALGAKGVLLGRPPLWGLASYGADGVQRVLELLQTELARDMAMCGRPTLKSIDRTVVQLHRA